MAMKGIINLNKSYHIFRGILDIDVQSRIFYAYFIQVGLGIKIVISYSNIEL